jgi:hypothetical protein
VRFAKFVIILYDFEIAGIQDFSSNFDVANHEGPGAANGGKLLMTTQATGSFRGGYFESEASKRKVRLR